MFALAEPTFDVAEKPFDPIERELEEIEHLRKQALKNRDILFCSPLARHLVEREIPRLIEIIRRIQRSGHGSVTMECNEWMQALLLKLRDEVSIVRDLIERN